MISWVMSYFDVSIVVTKCLGVRARTALRRVLCTAVAASSVPAHLPAGLHILPVRNVTDSGSHHSGTCGRCGATPHIGLLQCRGTVSAKHGATHSKDDTVPLCGLPLALW